MLILDIDSGSAPEWGIAIEVGFEDLVDMGEIQKGV